MKLNANLKIVGTNVVLVPYESKHVAKYHQWMKSEELQELTASEPLTLDEEYQMQKSWREDEDKCTFLILDRTRFEQTGVEIEALVGDTNIFLQPLLSDEELPEHAEAKDSNARLGEVEIMIAEASARGKRFGWEATLLMLFFGVEHLGIRQFSAITKDTNTKAMRMFERMKFVESKRTPVFKEVTFMRPIDECWIEWLRTEVGPCCTVPYHAEKRNE